MERIKHEKTVPIASNAGTIYVIIYQLVTFCRHM